MASAYVCEIRTPGPQAMGTENPVLIRMLTGSLNRQYGCFTVTFLTSSTFGIKSASSLNTAIRVKFGKF